MKLIFCKKCGDIVALLNTKRYCMCGASFGMYIDRINAKIGGEAIILGIDNESLYEAVHNIPKVGLGKRFEAFGIPTECETVERAKDV